METAEQVHEDVPVKKGRHRKKLLYSSILRQMEFYFSNSNLSKDRFLTKLLEDDENVPLSIFLTFNKIRKLTTNIEDIVKALQKSELLEVSEDKTTIKRKIPVSIKENTDECTIYVEHIKSDTTHEWVSSVFSEFGKVQYVSIPKYSYNKFNKGFAFVEFESPSEAQKALEYFDSIGLKMSSNMEPDKLCSITTFDKQDKGENTVQKTEVTKEAKEDEENAGTDSENKKRKLRENDEQDTKKKKKKKLNESVENTPEKQQTSESESKEPANNENKQQTEEDEKKRKKKALKRKAYFKELGLQILSKDEWRKMRNKYLNNQRKKMQQLKQHLHKKRFQMDDKLKVETDEEPMDTAISAQPEIEKKKLEFIPNVIVKVKLPEPCYDVKKTKADIKNVSANIQYIDVPQTASSDEVFIRFTDAESAKQFLNSKTLGELALLEGEEEKNYWEKIQHDRNTKVNKDKKKMRGRDKLLKKAERELGKHIRFDEEP